MLTASDYAPPRWLRNAHVQSVLGSSPLRRRTAEQRLVAAGALGLVQGLVGASQQIGHRGAGRVPLDAGLLVGGEAQHVVDDGAGREVGVVAERFQLHNCGLAQDLGQVLGALAGHRVGEAGQRGQGLIGGALALLGGAGRASYDVQVGDGFAASIVDGLRELGRGEVTVVPA